MGRASVLWGRVMRLAGLGPRGAVKLFEQVREPRAGRLVGTDRMGNKYYEELEAHQGRDRYVIYSEGKMPFGNATMVAPEWHGWLHHVHDNPPSEVAPQRVAYARHDHGTKSFTDDPNAAYRPPGHWMNQRTRTMGGMRDGHKLAYMYDADLAGMKKLIGADGTDRVQELLDNSGRQFAPAAENAPTPKPREVAAAQAATKAIE